MKPVTSKQLATQLGRKLDQAASALDDALTWVSSQREQAPRLEMEADRLTVKLRRLNNQARRYANASQQECAIGFFGLAQTGKEYLAGSLLSGDNGRLAIDLGGHPLDYAQQLNPWQQSATLAQRFTRQPLRGDAQWPVQLTLLSETEIASMLATVWHQRLHQPQPADEQLLAERMKNLLLYRQSEAVAGITPDDMVALWDRYNRVARPGQKALNSHFWPLAMDLAPLLGVDDRARLFSLLWDEDRELTALYRQLAHVLHHLGSARHVAAPLGTIDDATYSLLNTSALQDFNTPADITLQVCPRHQGRLLKPVTLSLSELALIGREIVFSLYAAPREALFEQVDVLDLPAPGARDDSNSQANPLALEVIQAKRGLLLSLASEEQQIHWLLVCTASAARNDTRTPGELLDFWVRQTQGEDSEERGRRKPGLIWALTPYDHRVTTGENFDAAVQRFVGQPGDSWGTMLMMDDKGVLRMATWLTNEVKRETKLARLSEQYQELRRELHDNLLGPWLQQDSAADPSVKQRIAESLLKALQVRTGVHGELLERLLPERDTLRHLFMQQYQGNESGHHELYALPNDDPFSIGVTIDLLSDQPAAFDADDGHEAVESESAAFAHQVYRYWINQLRQVPDNASLKELLGVTKPTLEMLTEELITGSIRLEIESALLSALSDASLGGLPAEQIAERQVSRALSVLGDYIAWLGFQSLPDEQKPDSRIHRGQKIFARPDASNATLGPGQRLTRLSARPLNTAAYYIYDWLVALNTLIVQNAGYSASQNISSAARQMLTLIAARVIA
ncbi:virulence factor [Izhakiella australiensis]|uniref:Virulence factor n=1 Tax=Izhakiella australiensis TaxID=1926881 RepID=A0A1S8YMU6_9GAMM|nr:virulence factor SrfC family protein [Izhakiella australiensis]OON40344.1 virulence factor [Izhakiella australiensis]